MFDNNLLKENLKKILKIKKIFEEARNDDWNTFLVEIRKIDKNILKEQFDNYGVKPEKVNKVRYEIIKSILDWKNIELNDIKKFKSIEQEIFQWKDIFRSWGNFSILYSIYYYDKKDFVSNALKEINKSLIKDLWLEWKVKINVVDLNWAQNFWLENFWTAIYNKSHKSQRTALQLNISSSWDDITSIEDNSIYIWLGKWPDIKNWINSNHKIFNINDLTYEIILKELEKYKDIIISDNFEKEQVINNWPSYWIYSPWSNAYKWDDFYKDWIMWIWWDELWNLENYSNRDKIKEKISELTNKKNPYNDSLACENFVRNIKIGDIIIPKQWKRNYLWYWIVKWNYEFNNNLKEYKSIRKVEWIKKWEWTEKEIWWIVLKTLTNITKYTDYVEKLKELIWINISNQITMQNSNKTSNLLNCKKQIILYWPPWTGKTYNVENIIENHSWENYSDLETNWRVEFITFHQSFSYEEFIEWIKPELNWESDNISYSIKDWIFKKIAEKANNNYQMSKKDIKEIEEKQLLYDKIDNLEIGKILKLRKWKNNKFEIINKTNNELKISSDSSNYKNIITIKISEIENVYFSTEKIDTNKKSANINWYKYWRQEDSYLLVIVDELKKQKVEINNIKNEELINYYLIIDEINRWNISKIFGELITLLEADKRLWEENEVITKLPYSKEDFWIPPNLYIVATMNTSDKSIVSLDTALRRRFWFKEMLPDYNLDGLNEEIEWINLSKLLQKINNRIEYLLDKDHLIWHSYFLKTKNITELKLVIYNEILPLLEEYFYWEEEKIRLVLWSKLFKNKDFDNKLFENNSIFDNDEPQYEINKSLSNQDFINALKNIIKSNEEN